MRLTVLAWSAAGGALVGLLAGVALFAVGALIGVLLPAATRAALGRLWWLGAIVCFLLLPLAGAIVGYMEGKLKL